MVQYFYIPKEHSNLILPAIDQWTSEPIYGWTIITGVYEDFDTEIEEDSLVYNVDVRRAKTYIKETFSGKKLKAFCLEGDLDYYAPTFKTLLLSLSGVLVFDSADDYLEYIKTL